MPETPSETRASDAAGNPPATVEDPSGKSAATENFPVGSWLLPARLRPHVAVFYRFARGADDIADSPRLTAEDKVARLDTLAAALAGEHDDPACAIALDLRRSLATCGVTARHGFDLLSAFRQDATKRRYADWDELMGYCARSASPVGRYLLDLHGEDPALYRHADPLCDALQVLNHLQDLQGDYRDLDRVYLPQDWLGEAGETVASLDRPAASPGLRRAIDRCLAATEPLLARSRPLAAGLASRRLAMESAVIWRLARRLHRRLEGADPIAGRVALSRGDFAAAGLGGVLAGLIGGGGRRPPRRAAAS